MRTGLEKEELTESPFGVPSCADMAQDAVGSKTKSHAPEEDIAYSLMGIFDVSMPTGYGEGRGPRIHASCQRDFEFQIDIDVEAGDRQTGAIYMGSKSPNFSHSFQSEISSSALDTQEPIRI